MDSDQEIIDAINLGSFKYAEAQLSKKLKKYPNKSYYYVLHYWYLYATGKHQECVEKCDSLKAKTPSDVSALDLLYDLYLKLGLPKSANEVFENAIKKYPSKEIVLRWHKKSIQSLDIKAIQKANFQLLKVASAEQKQALSYRTAFSYCLVNELCDLDSKESGLYKILALKTLTNLGSRPQSNQHVYVWACIYKSQGQLEKIVELVESSESKNIDLDLTLIYLDCLNQLEEWEKLHAKCHDLLFKELFNDFDTWKLYIRAHHALGKSLDELDFSSGTRNALLAKIEAKKVFGQDDDEAITRYFHAYKNKTCCFHDLRNYGTKTLLYKLFEEDLGNVDVLENYLKFRLFFKDPVDVAKLHTTDLKLIHIVGNISSGSVVSAIINLEYLLKKDSTNYKIRLWLVNLYTYINCSELARYHYKKLSIKMVQHDTMSYKILHDMKPSTASLNQLLEIYKFYMTADVEMNDSIAKAFETGVFNKLQDFVEFNTKLQNSVNKKLLVLELVRTSRLLNNNDYFHYFFKIIADEKFKLVKNITRPSSDNRDWEIDYKFTGSICAPNKFLPVLVKDEKYVTANYLKELIAMEKDRDLALSLLDEYVKVTAEKSLLTEFEKWYYELFTHIFRVLKLSQTESLDYLRANLVFSKVEVMLNKHVHFDGEYNSITNSVNDMVKVVQKMNLSVSNKAVGKLLSDFDKELKAYKPEFKSSKHFLDSSLLFEDEAFVKERVEEIDQNFKLSIVK